MTFVFLTLVVLLLGIIVSGNLTKTTSTAPANPEQWQQKGQGWRTAIDNPNFSVDIKKEDQLLSGQVGQVNLCDEPTIKNSFPNL